MLLNANLWPQHTVKPNKLNCQSWEQRKAYCKTMQGNRWFVPPLPGNPEFLEGFQQTVFKCKVRDGGCYKLLGAGILCSCPCPQKSGQDIPVNLQQDRCCSLVCNLLSLYKWKSVLSPLKFRALRTGSPVYFRQHS